MAREPESPRRDGNQNGTVRSPLASVRRTVDWYHSPRMPRSPFVLDGGRFGDEAFRLQNLLQQIPCSRITQSDADPDSRIQTCQSQVLQVAETLSRLIPNADSCMRTNSPSTRFRRQQLIQGG